MYLTDNCVKNNRLFKIVTLLLLHVADLVYTVPSLLIRVMEVEL